MSKLSTPIGEALEAAPAEEKKMVTILLHKSQPDEEPLFVSVNNETYLIQRGVQVEVPDYVAEVIYRSEEQRMANMAARKRI